MGKLDDGLFVSKRESDTDDQYFISYPETVHTEGFQTMIYTENRYEFFGSYDTENSKDNRRRWLITICGGLLFP